MQDIFNKVIVQVHGAIRFRWYAVACAWAVAIVGWAAVWSLPNQYESQARVYIDTETVLKPLLQGLAVGTDIHSEVSLMSAAMLSRPNLERVARKTGMYQRASTPEQSDALLTRLSRKVVVTPAGRDNTYAIAYTDADRFMAQRVVDTLVTTFVENTLGSKREDSTSAQQFLQQQISEYEARLRDAEERLADFKKHNLGLMPGQGGDYYTRLQSALTNLETLRARQRQVADRRDELARQLSGEEPTFGLVSPNSKAGLYDAKIAELRVRLDNLLIQYTDKHPEVVSIRETIARLEEEKKTAGTEPAGVVTSTDPQKLALRALDINPVYQNLRIGLSSADAELAELRAQIGEQERQMADLRSKVNTIPEIEAELVRLNRDYEVNKAQYTSLLQRLESARISNKAEESTEGVKFRIIEPARVPLVPIGPPRILLLTAILLAALAVGGLAAYTMHQLKPVLCTRQELRELTKLPVIGSISLFRAASRAPWFKRPGLLVGTSVALLVAAYVANVVVGVRLA